MNIKYVFAYVNGIRYKHQADSGSDVNLWPKRHFESLCNQMGYTPKLQTTTRPITAVNDTSIRTIGWFEATVKSQYASRMSRIFVMDDDQEDWPLLSRFDLFQLGYLKIDPDGRFAAKQATTDFDLTEEELSTAVKTLHETFKNVFQGVGCCNFHEVDLKIKEGSEPFVIKAIPCPIHLREPAQERLDYFVKLGILEPLPIGYPIRYCSPLLVVQKPNKKEVRLVVHYKRLNQQLDRTRHVPAVGLQEFCRVTQGFKYWFRLDLKDAFHQLRLSESSQELTIISTFAGCFKWKRMPQGTVNASDHFDHVMETVLANCNSTVSVRDDVLGGGTTRRKMLEEYGKVLAALQAAGLTCDPTKTAVGLEEIKFLGMIFGPEGLSPDPKKVDIIRKAKAPTNQDQLNSWICSVAWNDIYLDHFAEKVRPLRDLANKKGTFTWLPEHQKVFDEVKESLSQYCLNNYFQIERKTYIYTDAGKKSHDSSNPYGGFSAILAQADENGNQIPIQFASRSISPTEKNWSQCEIEARALRWGIDKYRYYLQGIDIVYCYVDCKALLPLFNNNNKSCPPRIERQRLACQDIPMQLIHLPGAKNPADWASRARTAENDATADDLADMDVSDALDHYLVKTIHEGETSEKPLAMTRIREETRKDTNLSFVLERIARNDWKHHKKDKRISPYFGIRDELSVIDDVIIRGSHQVVVPESMQAEAVGLCHSLAHQGETNTEKLLTNRLWFPGYSSTVRTEVKSCKICDHTNNDKRQEPAGYTPTPQKPFEIICVDFKGPFSDAYYCLVFLDQFSKWPECYWVKSTSFNAVKKHFDTFFALHGYPRVVKSDNGPPFSSTEFGNYLNSKGIRHLPIIPENPQANEVENVMRIVRKAHDVARIKGIDYKEYMTRVLMVIRATPSKATKVSPHYAVTGRIMDPGILDTDLPLDPQTGLSLEQYSEISRNLMKSKVETAMKHNSKPNRTHLDLRVGDTVLVRLGNNKRPEKDHYEVTRVRGNNITAVNKTTGRELRRHLSRFKWLQGPMHQSDDRKNENGENNQISQDSLLIPVPSKEGEQPQDEQPQRPPQGRAEQLQRGDRGNDAPNQRQVRFNPRAHTAEYDPQGTISPRRTTRQTTAATGVPVPEFPTTKTTLERSIQQQASARELHDQFRIDTQEAIRRNRED